jgi:pimeloyl-ACP methyl ester carboxylesterase
MVDHDLMRRVDRVGLAQLGSASDISEEFPSGARMLDRREVCDQLALAGAAATVGLSFGGLQAVHVATALPHLAPRLILHSCAPSSRPYPDNQIERFGAPVAFNPRLQRPTWRAMRTMTSSDTGLRVIMAYLSRLPVTEWWDSWTSADRAAA